MILLKKKILSSGECAFIANWILTHEERIKALGPDVYEGTSDNSLTGRYDVFNYLNVSLIQDILVPKLKDALTEVGAKFPLAVQCWANTFRKNEGIELHRHAPPGGPFKYFVANLFIAGPTKPGTFYEGHGDIENEPGVLCIFEDQVIHGVKPNLTDEVRISLAFDIHEYESYEYKELFLMNKKRYYIIT